MVANWPRVFGMSRETWLTTSGETGMRFSSALETIGCIAALIIVAIGAEDIRQEGLSAWRESAPAILIGIFVYLALTWMGRMLRALESAAAALAARNYRERDRDGIDG